MIKVRAFLEEHKKGRAEQKVKSVFSGVLLIIVECEILRWVGMEVRS